MEIIQEKSQTQVSAITRLYNKPFSYLHWHHSCEMCQVLDNEMRFMVDGIHFEAKAGDIVVIDGNVVHQFFANHGTARVRIVQFSPKVILEAGIPIRRCRMYISADEIAKVPGLMPQLTILLDMIESEGNEEENDYQKCLVSALYCLLTRHFAEEWVDRDRSESHKDFLRILEYINAHYEENINIKILAERLFMYRGRISALFKTYSNMSLNEYVYSLRIKKANELIEQGSSITEAALQSGFQNLRTFNRIYKKTVGVTPTGYKKGYIL